MKRIVKEKQRARRVLAERAGLLHTRVEGSPSTTHGFYYLALLLLTRMVVCHKCGYEWEYGGGMNLATCPSCTRKTPVDPDDES